jgi:hypothetical protein
MLIAEFPVKYPTVATKNIKVIVFGSINQDWHGRVIQRSEKMIPLSERVAKAEEIRTELLKESEDLQSRSNGKGENSDDENSQQQKGMEE